MEKKAICNQRAKDKIIAHRQCQATQSERLEWETNGHKGKRGLEQATR